MNSIKKDLLFSILSGLLLSIPYLVPHTGLILLFAFIPLLWMEESFAQSGQKKAWVFYGLTFLIWNLCTIFWIVNITVAGGIFAVLGNAFQMWVVFLLFTWVKKILRKRGRKEWMAYIFLAALWIAWEHFYYDAEISFPWLVLGNGFARNVSLVQWYELTGALGGSLWVWVCNLLLFFALSRSSAKIIGMVCACCLLLPPVFSLVRFYTYKENANPVEVVVLQPNIDPTSDKFGGMTQLEQDQRLLALAQQAVTQHTDYVFAPETCTQGVNEDVLPSNSSVQAYRHFALEHPSLSFVFGASSYKFFPQSLTKPSPIARRSASHWYEAYNTAIQVDSTASAQLYHKSKLVVGAEQMPYVDKIPLIEKLALNLGGTTGTLGTQEERTVFRHASGKSSVGVAICYESIYGAFCTGYVRNGAQMLAVITNDGWWGDTPGYRQHASYASLRAIETRRSVARSANTGISALIDQRGVFLARTPWWKEDVLRGNLNLNTALTPYVRRPNVLGQFCTLVMLLLLVYSSIMAVPVRKKG